MSADAWDRSGFGLGYAFESDPEFPATGQWDCPHYGFRADGSTPEPFRSRWGTPLIVRFVPAGAGQWVGSFEAGGLGGTTGVFPGPAPAHAVVVCEGQPYLVDVTTPSQTSSLELLPVTQICGVPDIDLLVLVTPTAMAAIGQAGVTWHSERLGLDELHVLTATAHGLRCEAKSLTSQPAQFTVDPRTGQVIAGPRFLDTWPGH